jgi:hypothetical protein
MSLFVLNNISISRLNRVNPSVGLNARYQNGFGL